MEQPHADQPHLYQAAWAICRVEWTQPAKCTCRWETRVMPKVIVIISHFLSLVWSSPADRAKKKKCQALKTCFQSGQLWLFFYVSWCWLFCTKNMFPSISEFNHFIIRQNKFMLTFEHFVIQLVWEETRLLHLLLASFSGFRKSSPLCGLHGGFSQSGVQILGEATRECWLLAWLSLHVWSACSSGETGLEQKGGNAGRELCISKLCLLVYYFHTPAQCRF